MKNHSAWGQRATTRRGAKANPMPLYVALYVIFAIVMAFMIFAPGQQSRQARPLGKAVVYSPSAEERCYEVILPNGLIETGYDQDADSKADWITVHRTGRDQEPMPHALFYALDPDGDGLWEQVWIDQAEDGWNGNEVVYETKTGSTLAGHER